MNNRSAQAGKPPNSRPLTAERIASPRIVQQLEAQQRQHQKLEFPHIIVNDQPLGLNITSASNTVANPFPLLPSNLVTPRSPAEATTTVQAPAGNKSPRVIIHPPNNTLNLSSVISCENDGRVIGELAVHNPPRKLDGPVTDSDVIYNETRLAAMLSKQKHHEIVGVQGRADAPAIQFKDRPKSATSSRKPHLLPRGQAPPGDEMVEPKPLASAKAIDLVERGKQGSGNSRPQSRYGIRKSPRERLMKDPLAPGLEIYGRPTNTLVVQGNTTDISVNTSSARDSESVRQLITESLQQYYEQQEANHPSIFEGLGDDTSTINTVGGSFPVVGHQPNSEQWRELYEHHHYTEVAPQQVPIDGPLVPGIAIEDMDSQAHSEFMLFDDESPRLPEGSVEARPISPLPAPVDSIKEILSHELGSRPNSPIQQKPVVNLVHMVKDMLHREPSLHQNPQAVRGSISGNLKKGFLPRNNQLRRGRPSSSSAMKPKRPLSAANSSEHGKRPATAAGEVRTKTRCLPELHVPTAQMTKHQPLQFIASGQNLAVGETLMDTISEMLNSQNSSHILSPEQIREKLKRPLSPRVAVMLMSHEILHRKEEIRREKVWNAKRSEIQVTVVAPPIDDQIQEHQIQMEVKEKGEFFPNELKQQMDKQLKMYKRIMSAPKTRVSDDFADLTQSQVLRVLSTDPVPPRSISPPLGPPSFLSYMSRPHQQLSSAHVQQQPSVQEFLQDLSKCVRFAGDEEIVDNTMHVATEHPVPPSELSPRSSAIRNAMIVTNSNKNEALIMLQQRYSTIHKEGSPIGMKTSECEGSEYDHSSSMLLEDSNHQNNIQNETMEASQSQQWEEPYLHQSHLCHPQLAPLPSNDKPNAEDNKMEIGLKWRNFLLSPQHAGGVSYQEFISPQLIQTDHKPFEDRFPKYRIDESRNHVVFIDTNPHKLVDLKINEQEDGNRGKTPQTYTGSLLESALPSVRNEAFYVDNYNPTYLLNTPELAQAVTFVDPNTIQSRPVSRGNYLYSYYKEQQDRLKRNYDRPPSSKGKGDGSSPPRTGNSSPKWGLLPHEVKNQRVLDQTTLKQGKFVDIADRQKDIVKLNVNVLSDRLDDNFKSVHIPAESTKVLQLNIPTFQHMDESDDESNFGGQKSKRNSSRGRSHPDSPQDLSAALPDEANLVQLIPKLAEKDKHERDRERSMKEQENVKSLLATTSIPLRSKKEEISARDNAMKYSKFVANRNKESKSVNWSKVKTPAKIAKEMDAPIPPELSPLAPSNNPSSNLGEGRNQDVAKMVETLNISGSEVMAGEAAVFLQAPQ